MSGSRRGRSQRWERERWKDRSGREIGRETERERERRSDRGEREKITNTKEFMEFYLVVLQSGYQTDRQRDREMEKIR